VAANSQLYLSIVHFLHAFTSYPTSAIEAHGVSVDAAAAADVKKKTTSVATTAKKKKKKTVAAATTKKKQGAVAVGYDDFLAPALYSTGIGGILSLIEVLTLQQQGDSNSGSSSSSSPKLLSGDDSSIVLLTAALRVLNDVGAVDVRGLQRFAASCQQQLYHIFQLLLPHASSIQQEQHGAESDSSESKSANVNNSKASSPPLLGELFQQLILFVGYYALLNADAQAVFRWGQSPTLLQRLCNLPLFFFIDDAGKRVLLPTLMAVCFRNEANKRVMLAELNKKILLDYLRVEVAAHKKLQQQQQHKTATAAKPKPNAFALTQRFPARLFAEAMRFFS
jgi:hypothetical protein